jgi:hypothetical protein
VPTEPRGLPFPPVSRRVIALVAAAAVVLLSVGAVLLLRGGGEDQATKRPATQPRGTGRAEALAYAPKNTPVVVGVDSGSPAAGLVLGQLVPRLTNGALTATDIAPLLGNEAVVAILDPRTQRSQLSLVARNEDDLRALTNRLDATGTYQGAQLYRGPRGSALARRGAEVVAATDEPTVRRALDTRQNATAHLTPQEFDRRLAGLDRTAAVRTVFDAKLLVRRRLPGVLATRWGRSLTTGAAVLTGGDDGLHVPFKLQTDASRINDADLPLATGPQAPQLRGSAPLLIGVRDFAPTIRFLRKADPDRFGALDSFQRDLPGFLRLDVDGLFNGLTNDATISSGDLLDHYVARTEPRDAGDWRRPLERVATLSGVLQNLGIDNVKLDEEPGDAYRLSVDGQLVIRAGVFGPTLVLTDDARASLPGAARAPTAPTPTGAAGALTLRLARSSVLALLRDQFGLPQDAAIVLDRLGDLTGWARADRAGLTGELRLEVR